MAKSGDPEKKSLNRIPADDEKKPMVMNNIVWKFFSSLKLALVLMLVLVGLSLIGTFLIQVPADLVSNSPDYNWWLENIARPETGAWYPALHLLGFFNLFHSVWFLAAGILLVLNIIICTLNRWNRLKINIFGKSLTKNEDFYKTGENQASIFNIRPGGQTVDKLQLFLRKHHFHVKSHTSGEKTYISADKNRYSPLGTYFIHLSLVLFVIGFMAGSFLGFRNTSFVVAEGSIMDVGNNTGLSLRLNSFIDEYWPDGSPKDFRSDVTIYEDGKEVKQGLIKVNHPLRINGIRFFQSFFGPSAALIIEDNSGKVIFRGGIALVDNVDNPPYTRNGGQLQLVQQDLLIYLVGRAANVEDTELSQGQIGLEVYDNTTNQPISGTRLDLNVPFEVNNLKVTFLGYGQYSGFQVSRDPGTNVIWVASVLFLLGLVMVFYFPRQQFWVLLENSQDGYKNIYLRYGLNRKSLIGEDFQKIVNEIKKVISA